MTKLLKVLLVLGVLLALSVSAVRVGAAAGGEYYISRKDGVYTLSNNEEMILSSKSLSSLLNSDIIPNVATVTFIDLESDESINIKKTGIKLKGALKLMGADLSVEADAELYELKLELYGGSVKIKEGELSVRDSVIKSEGGAAIRLDYSSNTELVFKSGEISAQSSSNGAIYTRYGVVKIVGGNVFCDTGAAVVSETSLYLSGGAEIRGELYDISTSVPIYLSEGTVPYQGEVRVKYEREFEKGSLVTVFRATEPDAVQRITLFDASLTEISLSFFEKREGIEEENFIAVYRPHKLDFYIEDKLFKSYLLLDGEKIEAPEAEERLGYKFSAWYDAPYGGERFEFDAPVHSDTSVYARYELLPPTYSISSIDTVYSPEGVELSFDSLTHPFLREGSLSYAWYKDGEYISSQKSLKLVGVSNSGTYKCKLTFTFLGDVVTLVTPDIGVLIERRDVDVPKLSPLSYNGLLQSSGLVGNEFYTVKEAGGCAVGEYPVTLTLRDSENYRFRGFDSPTLTLELIIERADNKWLREPNIKDAFEGFVLNPTGDAFFGEVEFLYSNSYDGVYNSLPPDAVGDYYMKAITVESPNYTSLASEPVRFSVLREELTGISLETPPDKLSYMAFEAVSTVGMAVLASYNSGRTELVSNELLNVFYPNGKYLEYGDASVTLSYLGMSVPLPLSVRRAEYDISSIVFLNQSAVFSGEFKYLGYQGELPVGLDGIPLYAELVGSALDVGVHVFQLRFKSESKNYMIPEPLSATLEILPLEREVVWDRVSFVYDGGLKLPRAYFLDERGASIYLNVSGARSYAGEYTAKVSELFGNYRLNNTSTPFRILKADYDMSGSFWSSLEFRYDGGEKQVVLSGLPQGVSVIGYSGNKAVNAGAYTARASLSFDSVNYNPPEVPSFDWEIKRGFYPLGGFSFIDTSFVYDGEEHFPRLSGSLPLGHDGIPLCFRFEKGVKDVGEGRTQVRIIFESESRNYEIPESGFAFVEILPRGINVSWGETELTFSGYMQVPTAFSRECDVRVAGAAFSAGSYTASAETLDGNYYVINSTCDFHIKRAANAWSIYPEIGVGYDGEPPNPTAESLGGSVSYRYFSNKELTDEIEPPTVYGVYYLVALTDGGENHLPLSSEGIRFEILELIPISISVSLLRENLKAFEVLMPKDFSVVIEYNSGKRENVTEDITLEYANGVGLRFGEGLVRISALGLTEEILLNVGRADYDMSGVKWSEESFSYDGGEKSIYLTGLPEGILVSEYIGNGMSDAGEYTVTARLIYDSENYNPPKLPSGALRIDKKQISVPEIPPLLYSGEYMSAKVENSDFYKYSKNLYRDAGKYSVEFSLSDSKNFEFSEGGEVITRVFEILPREIGIEIFDVELWRGEKLGEPKYALAGNIVEGDELSLEFFEKDGKIYASCGNPNYSLKVDEGELIRLDSISPRQKGMLFVFVLLLLILTLLTFILIFSRDKFRRAACRASLPRGEALPEYKAPPLLMCACESAEEVAEENEEPLPEEEITVTEPQITESLSGEEADALLSDTLAKTLLHRAPSVETFGSKRGIINVDTLSASFSAGDSVDINRMKSKNLIPYDTAYIKVLARGIIDKPLKVSANDFSLAAVKMIALTGGEAIKVKTVKIKMPRSSDE